MYFEFSEIKKDDFSIFIFISITFSNITIPQKTNSQCETIIFCISYYVYLWIKEDYTCFCNYSFFIGVDE